MAPTVNWFLQPQPIQSNVPSWYQAAYYPQQPTAPVGPSASCFFSVPEATEECDDCRVKGVLKYPFQPWTDISELIKVHTGIYSSLRFKDNDFDPSDDFGKKVYLADCTKDDEATSRSKMLYSLSAITRWKERLRSAESAPVNLIILSHLTALESIINALLETAKLTGSRPSEGRGSLLYSLYSIAVINFCSALASYEAAEEIVSCVDSRNSHLAGSDPLQRSLPIYMLPGAESAVRKFARLFRCPNWIISCRNKLSHSSQYPPSLSVLHEAITFALEWIDRYFWSKLLGDQCRLVDVDMRPPLVPADNAADSTCDKCKVATLDMLKYHSVARHGTGLLPVNSNLRQPLLPLNCPLKQRTRRAQPNRRFKPYSTAGAHRYLLRKLTGAQGDGRSLN